MDNQYERSLESLLDYLPRVELMRDMKQTETVDCFIGIQGFESRCCAAVRKFVALGFRARHAILVRYSDASMTVPNQAFAEEIAAGLAAAANGCAPHILEHDDHNLSVDFGEQLTAKLRTANIDLDSESTHLVIDVTVGSSRLLLEGLHAIMQRNAKVTLVYSEASKYRPYFDEYLQHVEERRVHPVESPEFLTKGVDRVEILRRLPGTNSDARPAYLVVFPSFAFTRSSAIIDELSPSRVQWIFGVPHLVENRWRLDAQKDYHRVLIEGSHRQCYVSTFDYRETFEVLERIYRKRRGDYSLFLASLGSKLQKVGQVLFHLLRPEVAAVVSIPRLWEHDRFSSDDPRAIYTISFESCRSLRDALWQTRRFRT